jgi:DNA-binding NarL/FixJ family response regulator
MSAAPRTKPAGAERRHRIFLVEDHPITREGFAHLLNLEPDFQVCGQIGTAAGALRAIAAANPDLVIVGLSLADASGLDLIKNLLQLEPDRPVLVLSTYDEVLYADRVVRAGARGYLNKGLPTAEVLGAIRKVLRGGVFLSERMQSRLLGKLTAGLPAGLISDAQQLSDRELEVFRLIGEGCSTRRIAAQLRLSVSTVGTYRAKIKDKLGLASPAELVQRAVAWVQAQH